MLQDKTDKQLPNLFHGQNLKRNFYFILVITITITQHGLGEFVFMKYLVRK